MTLPATIALVAFVVGLVVTAIIALFIWTVQDIIALSLPDDFNTETGEAKDDDA
ncbi:MAG: hypothetical protein ACYTEQ_28680 [Planctomycetota bacterium]|jgi:hypothetical protein